MRISDWSSDVCSSDLMAEHDRRRRAQADTMGATHHFNPFIRRDLIGAQNSAHFRIKHFGGCAGQRRKTFGFQPTEEILQRQAESLRSMRDFQWRKSMDMN